MSSQNVTVLRYHSLKGGSI